MRLAFLFAAISTFLCFAEIRQHPGGKQLPQERYIHVVSEQDSPVEQVYIKTKDGIYVAAAMRKPKGPGPFPVLIHFHGAPGGRGMEKLVQWVRGDTGGPVWERFLQEGFVVVVADYRRIEGRRMAEPLSPDAVTYIDDGMAVVDYVRGLKYVDPNRITVYGVSLGGNLVAHLIGRTKVHSAILGAPAVISFLGASMPPASPGANPADRFKNVKFDLEAARKNIAAIQCPVLILVGTADSLIEVDKPLHNLMAEAGKPVRMEVYENGYHDFCMGPQGHEGRAEPLLDATLDSLEKSLEFVRKGL
jgi:dienelactone hydrolase